MVHTAVGEAVAAPSDSGSRLEAGKAADQQWREKRVDETLRALRWAHRLGLAGRWSSVAAAALVAPVGILAIGVNDLPSQDPFRLGLWWIRYVLLWALLGLFAAGPVLVQTSRLRQRWPVKRAERDAIELPPEVVPAFPAPRSTPVELDARELRATARQYGIDRDETWGRTARGACLAAAYAAWLAYPLILARMIHLNPSDGFGVSLDFVLVLILLVIMVSPVPAGVSIWAWLRRRRLLREAAEEGLEVRDPARTPWD